MTGDDFSRIALAMPEAEAGSHMGQADFRVGGKIFATITPEKDYGMVKLTPEQQEMLCEAEPEIFQSVPGGWGKGGSTRVFYRHADEPTLTSAMTMAWRLRAGPKILKRLGLANG
jgi:hypothetical protein